MYPRLHVLRGFRAELRSLRPCVLIDFDGAALIQRRCRVLNATDFPRHLLTPAIQVFVACLEREAFRPAQGDGCRGSSEQLHPNLQRFAISRSRHRQRSSAIGILLKIPFRVYTNDIYRNACKACSQAPPVEKFRIQAG